MVKNVVCECEFLQDTPIKVPGRSRKLNKGTLVATGCECKTNGKKTKNINSVQVNVNAIDPSAPLGNFE